MQKEIRVKIKSVNELQFLYLFFQGFKAPIEIANRSYTIDGKSYIGMMSIFGGSEITAKLLCDDEEEQIRFLKGIKERAEVIDGGNK